jgi:hypothetical protein
MDEHSTHEKKGQIIKGPITFELSEEDIQAIKGGSRQISPKSIRVGNKAFAIRNHAFSDEIVTLFRQQ